MTTMVPKVESSRLRQLSPDLLRFIFEFDDTYKQLFQDQVLLDIWQTSWRNWHTSLLCPYKNLVMDWLMNMWGVYGDNVDESSYFRKRYHTDKIVVTTEFVGVDVYNDILYSDNSQDIYGEEDNYKCQVKVYMKHAAGMSVIFSGEILTDKQYKAYCQKENHYFENVIDIHSSSDTGLVLLQKL
jgi:hypothetical protein